MFKVVSQSLAVNTIDFSSIDLYEIGKHTFVLKAPSKTLRQGIVFKFQRGRIPQPDDVIHVSWLVDDKSRTNFERQVFAIQRKSADYHLHMDYPPELRLNMDDDGYVTGCAIHIDMDGEHVKVNQHSLSW